MGRSNILDDRFDSVANKLEQADDFQLKITILTDEINNLKEAIRENQEGLSAVDQYRLQNNQKLIDTLNRLNELSRELEIIKRTWHEGLAMKFIMNEIFFKVFLAI